VIGVVAGARRTSPATTGGDVPVGRVKRGNLDLKVYATGELHANHSTTLTAPPIGGGNLKITRLLHTGTAVKKGDVVVEFDPVEQRCCRRSRRSSKPMRIPPFKRQRTRSRS
jgi:multidrug efflux pump subunit AcrA (membrane-fusion protein)